MTNERIVTTERCRQFILAGNALFTLRSTRTGSRYTYVVNKADDKDMWFVAFLTGPDNTSDYTYLGILTDSGTFRLTKKSRMNAESTPVKAFTWYWNQLLSGTVHGVEVYHAGKCARCGRTLTVPESIESGFGPECITKLAA